MDHPSRPETTVGDKEHHPFCSQIALFALALSTLRVSFAVPCLGTPFMASSTCQHRRSRDRHGRLTMNPHDCRLTMNPGIDLPALQTHNEFDVSRDRYGVQANAPCENRERIRMLKIRSALSMPAEVCCRRSSLAPKLSPNCSHLLLQKLSQAHQAQKRTLICTYFNFAPVLQRPLGGQGCPRSKRCCLHEGLRKPNGC